MIWKGLILLCCALCVLGDGYHAVSEQHFKIIHKHKDHKEHKEHKERKEHKEQKELKENKEHQGHHGELSHIGSKEPEHHEEYAWSYPSYEYSYEVHDPHTHDMKGQKESRHGDDVKGEYWLVQPDGRKRTVSYHADKHSGFHAIVHYTHHHENKHEKDHKKEEGGEEDAGGEEGQGGEEGGESEEGGEGGEEGGNEENSEEQGEEGRGAEESRGREEEIGKWIHSRHWGYHNDKKHEHRGHEKRPDGLGIKSHSIMRGDGGHKRKNEHKHKNVGGMAIFEGLGSYGDKDDRIQWHGHDDRRDESRDESRGHQRKYKTGPIVRENYYHPRFYRHSLSQLKH